MTKCFAISSLALVLVLAACSGESRAVTASSADMAPSSAAPSSAAPATAAPVSSVAAATSTAAGIANAVTPSAAGNGLVSITPVRLLDTRVNSPTIDDQFTGTGLVAAGTTIELTVAGRGGIPADASAAVLNVTATGATANGYLTVWPCGQPRPLASSLNYGAGRDVANAVLTQIGDAGKVCLYAGVAPTHLVTDATGWFPAGTDFSAATPVRLLDTRPGSPTIDDQFTGTGLVAAGTTIELTVAGRGGIPADASAAVLNVTATGANANGYLTVWPCGQPRPLASSLNYGAGRDVANAVLTQIGDAGKVCLYAGVAPTHLVTDATGWFPAGTDFSAATPVRLLDTRPGSPTIDNQFTGTGLVAAGTTIELTVAGRGGIPADASAAVLNVTATGANANGYLTVWPCGQPRPLASSLNYGAGRDVANAVLTQIGDAGKVCLYAGVAPTHLVTDATGWFGGQGGGGGGGGAPKPPPIVTPLPPMQQGVWQSINPPLTYPDPVNQFGTQTIALSQSDPRVVYVGTCNEGIWKTTDAGANWAKVNTGENADEIDAGRNWTMAVDPTNANVLYTAAGYGRVQGLWKSTDGGVNWNQMLTEEMFELTQGDVYSVAIDPSDPQHLLLGFHADWTTGNGGVLESKNGGASWIVHQPQPSWGHGHYVFFITSTTWLLGTQDDGFWRTTNSGQSWDRVSEVKMAHGGSQLYRASNGVLYVGAANTLLRSTNDGASFSEVGVHGQDSYYGVIGDGAQLWAQPASTGNNTAEPDPPYYTSGETDGQTWTPYRPDLPFPENGPMAFAFDAANRIVYSSNWLAGVWRYKA